MAEVFGIVASAISLAATFTTCVDCFEYVQLGRQFGQDFETNQLVLDCTRARLVRWGQAVRIYDDPKLGKPDATSEELDMAGRTLVHITFLFSETEKISKGYQVLPETVEMGPLAKALHLKIKSSVNKRRKGPGLSKLMKWALNDASHLKKLIEGVTSLIDGLEKLFPPPPQQLHELLKEEIEGVQNNEEELKLLKNVTKNIDRSLENAANEALKGHRYSNIAIKGGRALSGDTFLAGWTMGAIGPAHTYESLVLEGNGRIQMGNQYGGKGIWDD